MTQGDDGDYWTDLPGTQQAKATTRAPSVETIEGLTPLDAQLGMTAPLTVPPALHEALFGQADLIEGRSILPLHTYAILDAAKVPGLPEMLEASGLDHACLYKGAAAGELRDVAPWIVRLEEGDAFTRGLFTQGKGPHQLWDAEPGVFLRSQDTLDQLRNHLRKFTKLKDENGKWYYLRFWEPSALPALIETETPPFANEDDSPIAKAVSRHADRAWVATFHSAGALPAPRVLTAKGRASLDHLIEDRFVAEFSVQLHGAAPDQMRRLAVNSPASLEPVIAQVINDLRNVGVTRRSDVGRLAVLATFYGSRMLWDPRVAPLARSILGRVDRAAPVRALRFEEALRLRPRHALMTSDEGLRRTVRDLARMGSTRSRPFDPDPAWGFDGPETVTAFEAACGREQDRHGLPMSDAGPHRGIHRLLARLWTPFFMDDPVHGKVVDRLRGRSDGLVEEIAADLDGRLEDKESKRG